MTGQETKWWGWGDLGKTYPLGDSPRFWPFLRKELDLRGDESYPIVDVQDIELEDPSIGTATLRSLESIVGREYVSTEKYARLTHSMGKGYRDLIRIRKGIVPNPPDAVIFPADEEQVRRIIEFATKGNIAVIPFGGGTSVVGGVEAIRSPDSDGAVSLDLKRMDEILRIDPVSLTAVVQAGIGGPKLEEWLNNAGYTLGHFPQSFEFSTMGGWVATRGAGQKSTRYGKIERMVESLRLVSPRGLIETREAPAFATGPEMRHLLMGSEGVYGVITQVTVRIHLLPEVIDHRGVLFRDLTQGLRAIRKMMQEGLRPSTVRLSDQAETRSMLALSRDPPGAFGSLKRGLGIWLVKRRGYSLSTGCMMILGFEGRLSQVDQERSRTIQICKREGGIHLGRSPGESWYSERFELPYLRDVLIDHGLMVDTLETCTNWENLENLYTGVKGAIQEGIAKRGIRGLVLCHVSHAYPEGASLYFTFMAKMVKGHEIEQWIDVKRSASERIIERGGTISHHHGVGIDHSEWMRREHGEAGLEALKAVKRELDPNGIMNPSKLFGRTE